MAQFDIIIVGSGAAGAAAAWRLSEQNSGLRIACIERGDWMDPARYPSTRIDWELLKFSEFSPLPGVRKSSADYKIDDSDSDIAIANFNAVGGATILYSGHFPRFHPSDFRVRTLDGVAEDWPLSYEDLASYYDLNDQMMSVSGLAGDPAYPPIEGLLPPVPAGDIGRILGPALNRLNWHWWPSYSAIATRAARGRAPCINLGPCNTGCPQGAKSSVDVTYWPLALRNGVELLTNTVCQRVLVEDGRVSGVQICRSDGAIETLSARIVILAANAVGTARLLLNSACAGHENGLANSSGLVGKNLMLHPLGYVEASFDEQLDTDKGPQGCSIYSHEFYETDVSRGFVRGYTMHFLRGTGPVEAAKAAMDRRELKWGDGFLERFRAIYRRKLFMAIICEDLPSVSNQVSLRHDVIDTDGMPLVKVDYRLEENTRKMLGHGLSMGKTLMREAGGKKVMAYGPVRNTGWHLMGTARMGTDPDTSVVDPRGECHDVKGLHIFDGSIFVTSAGVNPASTIQALSLYLSDRLTQRMAEVLQ